MGYSILFMFFVAAGLFAVLAPMSTAAISASNVVIGSTIINYGQSTTVNMVINGGLAPYTANLIWCKPSPLYQCLPQGVLANSPSANLPITGNYLSFTVNAFSYNTLQITFNGITSTITMPAIITTNITSATNNMNPNNAVFANTIYGPWQFNGVVTDAGSNTFYLSSLPGNGPMIGTIPATPQMNFVTPGGSLAFITNAGNDTLSMVKINEGPPITYNVIAVITTGASPQALISPPAEISASAPSIVGTVNENTNNITIINTATKQVMGSVGIGPGSHPIAVAAYSNNTGNGMAFADTGTNNITFMTVSNSNTFSVSKKSINLPSGCSDPYSLSTFFNNGGTPYLYVACYASNSVAIVNLVSMSAEANVIQLPSGAHPEGIAAAQYGYVYTADTGTNEVSVINASSSNPGVISEITTGPGGLTFNAPESITVAPNQPLLYVTNYNSNTISTVNPFADFITHNYIVSSQSVSEPDYLSVSPDGSLLYVSNYGTNSISVLSSSSYAIDANLPANSPTGVTLFPNFFYNGTNPGDIHFSISTTNNQLEATLKQGSAVLSTTVTNSYPVSLTSNSASNYQYTFSTGGNANYTPMFLAKFFSVMPSFPTIQFKLTFNNGTSVILRNQNQSFSISTMQDSASVFPLTLTANVQTFGNQLPANVYVNGVAINTLTTGFTETINALAVGSQSLVFNSISNGNYIAVDPSFYINVQAPLGASGTGYTTLSDNVSSTSNSTSPVAHAFLISSTGVNATSLYQTQLPSTIKIPGAHSLNISFACSFVSGGQHYAFTGIIYGIGVNSGCDTNYTVYGSAYEALYSSASISTITTSSTTSSSSTTTISAASLPVFIGHSFITATNATANSITALSYPCTMQSSNISPFILKNGTWVAILPFTLNATACTISFIVPSDPIVALFENTTALTTSVASTTVSTTLQSTTVPTTSVLPSQTHSSSAGLETIIAIVVAIVIIAVIAYILSSKGRNHRR